MLGTRHQHDVARLQHGPYSFVITPELDHTDALEHCVSFMLGVDMPSTITRVRVDIIGSSDHHVDAHISLGRSQNAKNGQVLVNLGNRHQLDAMCGQEGLRHSGLVVKESNHRIVWKLGKRGVAWNALLRNTLEQLTNLRGTVATMATQRADRRQLAGLGPTSHRLRVNAKKRRDLSRGEQFICLGLPTSHVILTVDENRVTDPNCQNVQLLAFSEQSLVTNAHFS